MKNMFIHTDEKVEDMMDFVAENYIGQVLFLFSKSRVVKNLQLQIRTNPIIHHILPQVWHWHTSRSASLRKFSSRRNSARRCPVSHLTLAKAHIWIPCKFMENWCACVRLPGAVEWRSTPDGRRLPWASQRSSLASVCSGKSHRFPFFSFPQSLGQVRLNKK